MSKKDTQHYCLQCGTSLSLQQLEDRWREVCPNCGWIYYRQLKVGAAALIEQVGCLLLLRRASNPWRGDWNLPAGYVEFDEDPARAAERETLEETGLHVRALQLLEAVYFDDDPRGNGVLLVYRCEVQSGQLRNNVEALELAFFDPATVPDNLAGAGHQRIIQDWRHRRWLKSTPPQD